MSPFSSVLHRSKSCHILLWQHPSFGQGHHGPQSLRSGHRVKIQQTPMACYQRRHMRGYGNLRPKVWVFVTSRNCFFCWMFCFFLWWLGDDVWRFQIERCFMIWDWEHKPNGNERNAGVGRVRQSREGLSGLSDPEGGEFYGLKIRSMAMWQPDTARNKGSGSLSYIYNIYIYNIYNIYI